MIDPLGGLALAVAWEYIPGAEKGPLKCIPALITARELSL
jgi:hypothetical protein